jgi:hypothetical protein
MNKIKLAIGAGGATIGWIQKISDYRSVRVNI